MGLSLLILFFLIICLVRSYDKAIISIVVLSTWLDQFSVLGSNILTYLCVFSLCLLPIHKNLIKSIHNLPVKLGLVLFSVSYIISGFFMGTPKYVPAILNVIREIVIFIIFFLVIYNKPVTNVKFFVKVSLFYVILITSLTGLEFILGENPYMKFVNAHSLYQEDKYIEEIRYGFKRCQSIFSMHTTLGGISIVSFLPIAWYYYKKDGKLGITSILVLLFSLFCCIASGSRSTIIGWTICLFAFMNKSFLSPKTLILAAFVVFGLLYFSGDVFNQILDSITSSDDIEGSNVDMRGVQLGISLNFLQKSPLFGNGVYAWTEITKYTDLLGAESVWFGLMIDRGIMGILSLVAINIQLVLYTFYKQCKGISFVILGFLFSASLSSLPHLFYTYIFAVVVVMVILSYRVCDFKQFKK